MLRTSDLFLPISIVLALLYGVHIKGLFQDQGAPIAVLESASGTVRRHPVEKLQWDRIQEGSPLALRDTVATAEQSTAKLAFKDGGELWLEPESMVTLEPERGEIKLVFLKGTGKLLKAATSRGETSPQSRSQGSALIKPVIIKGHPKELDAGGLVISTATLPSAPEIHSPGNDVFIDFNHTKALELKYSLPKDTAQPAPEAKEFEILLQPVRKDLPPRVYRSIKSEFTFNFKDLPTGEYLWSVRAISGDGKRGRASAQRRVHIQAHVEARQPIVFPPVIRDAH